MTVGWQGGEPTLMGLDFFERSVEHVSGTRSPASRSLHDPDQRHEIDDAWAVFLKRHNVLVGLSVDGPRELHDVYRVDKGGKGSFDDVMRGWRA